MKEKDIVTYVGNKGIIKNQSGEVLIIKEIGTEKWELPGGKMQVTEFESTLQECLTRELKEELGGNFIFKIGSHVGHMFRYFDKPRDPNVSYVFLNLFEVEYLSGDINMQAEEVIDFAWVTKDTYNNFEYINGYKEALDKYFSREMV